MPTKGAHAKRSSTYEKIASRLARLNPPVKIGEHLVESSLVAKDNTLDGINFEPTIDRKTNKPTLLAALRAAKDTLGKPAFAESGIDPAHWALEASYGETLGIGFREIWRLRLSNRPLRWNEGKPGLNLPSLDAGFSAHFGDNPTLPDLSSLHCAVTRVICNIHIDEMGFVMESADGEIAVNPDFLRHTIVELLWKTNLRGKLPDWAVDHVNLIIPSSPNKYSRVGVSFDLVQSDKVKLAVTGTCGLAGGFNCSGTLNLTGTHDIFGGGR